jgi:hypothetical protein
MSFDYVIDSFSDTANGKEAVGRLVWDADEYAAVSGPYGAGYIELGDYTVKVRNVETHPGMKPGYCLPGADGDDICFFIPLDPKFQTDRDGIGIHPDGNVPGTEGCIGLQKADFEDFWSKWNRTAIGNRPTSLTVRKVSTLLRMERTSESGLWAKQESVATSSLNFATGFLGCRMGAARDPLDENAVQRLLTILRAVSYVESVHGTQGANQPARDPLQCGNPNDSWWKELTGQSGNGSRFVRGPGLSNLWAKDVAAAAEATAGFDANASLSLIEKNDGHDDANFGSAHSYLWGAIYLVYQINTTAGDPAFACGDLSDDRLISGAVAYNGGGVSDYRKRITDALQIIGGFPSSFADRNHRAAAIAANSVFEQRIRDISDFLTTGQRLEKFFPNGITKISLSIKVAGAEIGFEVFGPEHAQARPGSSE